MARTKEERLLLHAYYILKEEHATIGALLSHPLQKEKISKKSGVGLRSMDSILVQLTRTNFLKKKGEGLFFLTQQALDYIEKELL